MDSNKPAWRGSMAPDGVNSGDVPHDACGIVTPLESRLAGRDGALLGACLAEQCAQAQGRLEGRLRRGLPPQRFAVVLACAQALHAARGVLAAQSRAASPTHPHPLLSAIAAFRN